jgi:hypothetical protein
VHAGLPGCEARRRCFRRSIETVNSSLFNVLQHFGILTVVTSTMSCFSRCFRRAGPETSSIEHHQFTTIWQEKKQATRRPLTPVPSEGWEAYMQQQSPLLRLPPEIRNIIWGLCTQGYTLHLRVLTQLDASPLRLIEPHWPCEGEAATARSLSLPFTCRRM